MQIRFGGEPQVLPLAFLHDVTLSLPTTEWPARMCLLRIKVTHVPVGVPRTDYGILVASSAEKEKSVYFGMSLEWCRGTEHHGMARFKPEIVRWKEQRWQITAGDEPEMVNCKYTPEKLIQLFHEATLHKLLPHLLPEIGKPTEMLPAAGMLVLLVPGADEADEADKVKFDWAGMQRVVEDERQKINDNLMDQWIDGDNQDGEVSARLLHRRMILSCRTFSDRAPAHPPK
jgi:hypothetical protein